MTLRERVVEVSAFVGPGLEGNPAGVCLLDAPADPAEMQAVAAEVGHAETAFLWPEDGAWRLRWFTPEVEVDLCGHATLAAAFVLSQGQLEPLTFQTRSGTLTCRLEEDGRLTLAVVRGGSPESVLVDGREQVPDLVEEHGGVAGINGGFFVMAAIRATDNSMIGPCLPGNRTDWVLDTDEERLRKIAGRPLVMWSPEKIAFRPFRPDRHMDPSGIEAELPGLTDAFVAGAWLVSGGRAFLEDEIKPFSAQDSHEIRPRTFIGVTREGELVAGASVRSANTARLAQAALAAGCMEAVLLDSGYSTSLVYDGELLAVGHRTRSVKSRPIPHAIILKGTLASAENTTQP
jgi:hypothetical protein